jgi:hypothetical protein
MRNRCCLCCSTCAGAGCWTNSCSSAAGRGTNLALLRTRLSLLLLGVDSCLPSATHRSVPGLLLRMVRVTGHCLTSATHWAVPGLLLRMVRVTGHCLTSATHWAVPGLLLRMVRVTGHCLTSATHWAVPGLFLRVVRASVREALGQAEQGKGGPAFDLQEAGDAGCRVQNIEDMPC